jgi:hypothetical protein
MERLSAAVIRSIRFIVEFNIKELMGGRQEIRICPLKGIVRFSEVSVTGSLLYKDNFVSIVFLNFV